MIEQASAACVEVPHLEPGEAVLVDMSAEQYHAYRAAVSRSELVHLITRPAHYHAVHEARTVAAQPSTKELRLGTNVHLCALEPAELMRRAFVPGPRRGLDIWGRPRRPDSIDLTRDGFDQIVAIASSFHAHPLIRNLLAAPHRFEQTIMWRPAAVPSLLVRVRTDVLVDVDQTLEMVVDLKTSEDPSPSAFARSCAKHRYYLQAAMYRDAVAALYPDRDVHFLFAAVAKSAPFESACYDLADDALELGRNQYTAAMVDLLRRRETGDWTAGWQHSIHTLSLPRWVTKQ
jgi:hypothetical protein